MATFYAVTSVGSYIVPVQNISAEDQNKPEPNQKKAVGKQGDNYYVRVCIGMNLTDD